MTFIEFAFWFTLAAMIATVVATGLDERDWQRKHAKAPRRTNAFRAQDRAVRWMISRGDHLN